MEDLVTALDPITEDFGGTLIQPGDAGFDAARNVWNAMIDRRPALIACCKHTADVIAAVKLAVARDLPIAIRGGGHNVAGHAVCDNGVMIDMSLMRNVTVDAEARVAIVEGGALWSDVDKATQAHGLATPGALSPRRAWPG